MEIMKREDNKKYPLADINEWFNNAFLNLWRHPHPWPMDIESRYSASMVRENVTEDEKNFYLQIELPGVKKKDIKVEIDANTLHITGEYKNQTKNQKEAFSFNRSFTIPSNIDKEKIEAHYADGMLTITMAKSEPSKPRSIEIV